MGRSTADDSGSRRRSLGRWGFEGAGFDPPEAMLRWLEERLGPPGAPFPRFDPSVATVLASEMASESAPRDLPARSELGVDVSTDPLDRLAHARGQGIPDLLRLRSGTLRRLPDAVVRPASDGEVEAVLRAAATHDLHVVPWGGGTSVTGGVNTPRSDAPVVVMDLERLAELEDIVEDIDAASGLATFGAGIRGPALEAALGEHGLTLGHFPQSFELSTLGGWIVTHSTGQESLRYGRIVDRVAGLDVVSPAERIRVPALPASATGPDLRQWIAGSEGRFGVVVRATVRVRQRPRSMRVEAAMLPDWASGVEVCRRLVRDGVGLSLLRLSDEPETEVAMTVGLGEGPFAPLARGWLRFRGVWGGCLLLLGAAADGNDAGDMAADVALEEARLAVADARGAWLGARPGRHWVRDRFRHPYLRDGLLDRGIATDTLETAAPWSRLPALYDAVRRALRESVGGEGSPREAEIPVLCHLSHPYEDGASLYFTFFFHAPPDGDRAVARWADLKRRASEAIAEAGGATSHHHGVGAWHAPWAPREWGRAGGEMLRAVAERLDPVGVLNPHVLLDPTDRLED